MQPRPESYDVIVVGAGVIGLACAWRAAIAEPSVLVLERAEPAGGRDPGRGGDAGAGRRAAVRRAGAAGDDAARRRRCIRTSSPSSRGDAGRDAGYRRLGALHVALDRDEAAELRRRHELQRSLGLEAEWLGPESLPRAGARASARPFTAASTCPDEAAVDPRRLSAALLAALEIGGRGGARWREVEEAEARADPESSALRLSDGSEARAAGSCSPTGAWSGQVDWLPADGAAAGAAGEGPDPRAAGGRRGSPSASGSSPRSGCTWFRETTAASIVGATVEERGFDDDGDRGRGARAAARGLPPAARRRGAGAGRGGRRASARYPGQPADGRAAARSTACCWRPATTATASCWRR